MSQPENLLTRHLEDVNESYFEHMGVAGYYAFWFSIAAFTAFVHAIFPFLFEKTASGILLKLHARMSKTARGAVGDAQIQG